MSTNYRTLLGFKFPLLKFYFSTPHDMNRIKKKYDYQARKNRSPKSH